VPAGHPLACGLSRPGAGRWGVSQERHVLGSSPLGSGYRWAPAPPRRRCPPMESSADRCWLCSPRQRSA
jgi:hypothetical protein